jgi:hypothetical protein
VKERSECMCKQNNREINLVFRRKSHSWCHLLSYLCCHADLDGSKGNGLRLLFRKWPALKSVKTPTFLSFFRGYSHFFEVNVEMKPQIRPRPLLSHLLQIIIQ